MKTSLEHLPHRKQRNLARIVEVLFAEFEDALSTATSKRKKQGRILKIILFGSHARGGWVEDTSSGYMSDYDLLIIVSHTELTDYKYWDKAQDFFMRDAPLWFTRDKFFKPEVNIIVETLTDMNSELAKGAYFYADIYREGIMLYELQRSRKLKQPQPLNAQDAYDVAQEHFDIWYPKAEEFFIIHQDALARTYLNNAAFILHQATESTYKCLLLVLTNYMSDSHNIEFMRSLCEDMDDRLIEVWPRYYKRHRKRFQLLKRAYVEARYSKHYQITIEELEWLGTRVEHLQALCETICKEHLARLNKDKPQSN